MQYIFKFAENSITQSQSCWNRNVTINSSEISFTQRHVSNIIFGAAKVGISKLVNRRLQWWLGQLVQISYLRGLAAPVPIKLCSDHHTDDLFIFRDKLIWIKVRLTVVGRSWLSLWVIYFKSGLPFLGKQVFDVDTIINKICNTFLNSQKIVSLRVKVVEIEMLVHVPMPLC